MRGLIVALLSSLALLGLARDRSLCESTGECESLSSALLQSKPAKAAGAAEMMEADLTDGPILDEVHVADPSAPANGIHCKFERLIIEYDMGLDNASASEDDFCEEADGTTHLLDPAAVEAHLSDVSVGEDVVLEPSGTSLLDAQQRMMLGIIGARKQARTVHAARGVVECADGASTGYQSPHNTCPSIKPYCQSYPNLQKTCPVTCNTCTDISFEFDGVRAVRMLGLIAELNDVGVGYLGNSRSAREAFALQEMDQVANTLSKSTYGKVTVDVAASRAVTISLPINGLQSNGSPLPFSTSGECSGKGAQVDLGRRMREALPADVNLAEFDSLVFYYPTEIAGQFGWCGIGGWAYGGVVTVDPQPGGRFTVSRSSSTWLKGISMRKFFNAGTGTVLAHEFGHQLGFGHAAGTGNAAPSDEQAWKANLANYGDNSAIMGNDASVQNSFTAVVRWRLGALPEASINAATVSGQAFDLRALTLSPSSSVVSSAVFKCPNCRSKILNSDGSAKHSWSGGYIWISFRGSTSACNDEGCHIDHSHHYNKVFVHYQQPTGGLNYMTTERWYYLGAGETYSPPGADKRIAVCSTDGDTAKIIIYDGASTSFDQADCTSSGGGGSGGNTPVSDPTRAPTAQPTSTPTGAPTPSPTAVPTSMPTQVSGSNIISSCSFETDSGCNVWTNSDDDQFDWTRKSGSTPSSGTGPSAAADGSYYLFIETSSPRKSGDEAILKTSLPLNGGGKLKFKYSMYGAYTGHLDVVVGSEVVWRKEGDQGQSWHDAVVDLSSSTSGTVELSFVGVRGSSWKGDIAIDQVIVEG